MSLSRSGGGDNGRRENVKAETNRTKEIKDQILTKDFRCLLSLIFTLLISPLFSRPLYLALCKLDDIQWTLSFFRPGPSSTRSWPKDATNSQSHFGDIRIYYSGIYPSLNAPLTGRLVIHWVLLTLVVNHHFWWSFNDFHVLSALADRHESIGLMN